MGYEAFKAENPNHNIKIMFELFKPPGLNITMSKWIKSEVEL